MSPPLTEIAVLEQVSGLIASRKFDQLDKLIDTALAVEPESANLLNARGCLFTGMGRHHEALKWYSSALQYNPSAAGIWNNLGTAFMQLKYFGAAISAHKRAIELSGSEAFMHHNLGLCLAENGQHGEAIQAYNRTIELEPNHRAARWDRARSYLYLGNYMQGWPDYEVRLISGQIPQRHNAGEKWAGEPYVGKRLLILVEQGFGDTLWALRYLPKVKALGGDLIIECKKELAPIIRSLGVADKIISYGDTLPDTDFYLYICSLPGLFWQNLRALAATPYITASPERVEKFKPLVNIHRKKLKVGIVWSGSVTFGKNSERALPLSRLLEAVDMPGVQLFSLQKGPPAGELTDRVHGKNIIDLAGVIEDFADTAALIANLDLVIMTDSALAHLAGAMGKPVWVLLGHSAHWLWLLDRADSPWYSSVRLFRPRVEGDWHHVLDIVATELLKLTMS